MGLDEPHDPDKSSTKSVNLGFDSTSLWHQPFNRYAWVVEYAHSKYEMSYHGEHTIILGHVFSMLARLFFTADNKEERDFYKNNLDALAEVAKQLSSPKSKIWKFKTVEMAENYLRLNDERFAFKMARIIRPAVKLIKEDLKTKQDTEVVVRNIRLRDAVKARREQDMRYGRHGRVL
ncbi:hypothetical protein FLAG1_06226 [Fusarium langsethiae]|uniref:Uncharacterized protein n=1 Tax=Fusarium langsethiae TaxID=179993 RepID=A0A0M9EVQ0_FUSLA|nr:hypothetical protein FLAG1_06226 [Fusarium langsethiae]GKU03586.1 unnamed protein product [Fusarium langsethiae]GKU21460.1 unnamed protein product [Fusarium langsethiae]